MATDEQQYNVRQATEADLPALTDVRTPVALHKDRLRDANGDGLLYLVVEQSGMMVGFGLLVFERPSTWPDANDDPHLPAIVDLFVRADCRSRGAGSSLIARMEEIACSRGYTYLHMSVDPIDNPKAHQLYLRLGYRAIQTQVCRLHWEFTDSDGNIHEGDEWNIDMAKNLGQGTANNRVG